MRYKFKILYLVLLTQFLLSQTKFHKEIPRSDEKELKVKIFGSAGTFYISPGERDKIAIIDGRSEKGKTIVDVNYYVEDEIGYLEFETKRGILKNTDDEKWYIKLCDDIPTSLEVEFGASYAVIELGGMSVKNLKISTGVSSAKLKFTQPNKMIMRKLEVETGVSEFEIENLGNAKFRKFTFSGGMGSFDIDLSGEILDEADLKLSLGLGDLNIRIPRDIGAVISTSSGLFSPKKFDDFYKRDGSFISYNYNDAKKKIKLFIESGLGSIKVKWID